MGDVPFHLKWAIKVTHPLQKLLTSTDFRLTNAIFFTSLRFEVQQAELLVSSLATGWAHVSILWRFVWQTNCFMWRRYFMQDKAIFNTRKHSRVQTSTNAYSVAIYQMSIAHTFLIRVWKILASKHSPRQSSNHQNLPVINLFLTSMAFFLPEFQHKFCQQLSEYLDLLHNQQTSHRQYCNKQPTIHRMPNTFITHFINISNFTYIITSAHNTS